ELRQGRRRIRGGDRRLLPDAESTGMYRLVRADRDDRRDAPRKNRLARQVAGAARSGKRQRDQKRQAGKDHHFERRPRDRHRVCRAEAERGEQADLDRAPRRRPPEAAQGDREVADHRQVAGSEAEQTALRTEQPEQRRKRGAGENRERDERRRPCDGAGGTPTQKQRRPEDGERQQRGLAKVGVRRGDDNRPEERGEWSSLRPDTADEDAVEKSADHAGAQEPDERHRPG